jgi:hypothetical protein
MCADQPRNRTVGSKMTESEYEKLAAVAEQEGQTLGEWVREVLLERAEPVAQRYPSADGFLCGSWWGNANIGSSDCSRGL